MELPFFRPKKESATRPKDAFLELRKDALNERTRAKRLTRIHSNKIAEGKSPWPIYQNVMEEYFVDWFDGFEKSMPNIYKEIQELVQKTHESGAQALAVDVFGETHGKGMGFDKTICATLVRAREDSDYKETVEGNLFETTIQNRLLHAIDSYEGKFLLFTFRPYAGISPTMFRKGAESYAGNQLVRLLEKLYSRLSPGGLGVMKIIGLPAALITTLKNHLSTINIPFEIDSQENTLIVRKTLV